MDKLEVKEDQRVSWGTGRGRKTGSVSRIVSHTDIKHHKALNVDYEEYEVDEVWVVEDGQGTDDAQKVSLEELSPLK